MAVRWHVDSKGGDKKFETGEDYAGFQPLNWVGMEVGYLC